MELFSADTKQGDYSNLNTSKLTREAFASAMHLMESMPDYRIEIVVPQEFYAYVKDKIGRDPDAGDILKELAYFG